MVVHNEDEIFSSDRQKHVSLEYGMTREGVARDIAILKEWIHKQPHLPDLSTLNEDGFLEAMLILNKNSVERAKHAVDNFFTVRTSHPSFFSNRSLKDADIMESFDHVKLVILPGLTPEGHRVMLFQICPEAFLFNLHSLMQRCSMLADYYLQHGVDFTGIHVLHDLQHVGMAHLSRFSLPLMRSMVVAMKAHPIRIPKITIINTPNILDKLIALFRTFLSPKLMSRISTYKDSSPILDILPSHMVPKDYGGEAPSLNELNEFWRKRMEESDEYFATCDLLHTDERKRISQDKCPSTDFGQNGSFRQLTVD